jgi:hypothetical protein
MRGDRTRRVVVRMMAGLVVGVVVGRVVLVVMVSVVVPVVAVTVVAVTVVMPVVVAVSGAGRAGDDERADEDEDGGHARREGVLQRCSRTESDAVLSAADVHSRVTFWRATLGPYG